MTLNLVRGVAGHGEGEEQLFDLHHGLEPAHVPQHVLAAHHLVTEALDRL